MAFLTLELQTKGKTCLIPPNDPNDTKKIYKIGISYILAFHLAFATFIGLFQFFWGPWSLRSPVARISDISDPFIIRKNYCWKFPIFDHCDWGTSLKLDHFLTFHIFIIDIYLANSINVDTLLCMLEKLGSNLPLIMPHKTFPTRNNWHEIIF